MESMYELIDEGFGLFGVLETSTNSIIHRGMTKDEAQLWINRLNEGSGFEGRTPSFLTEGEYNGK
jgi:hypothetical protein